MRPKDTESGYHHQMRIVETNEALQAFVAELVHAPYLALDTEFLRDQTYYPRLCLIQVAAPGVEGIIDPLAPGLDLTPFYDLIRRPGIIKVLHAARQDIEIFFLQGGVLPNPLFDSQIAAMVCGFGDSIGYEQLVQRLTGGRIDKSSRFTDWSRRPLTDRQLTYAIEDVTHLRDVYVKLATQLSEQGRIDWLDTEMDILTSIETYRLEPEDAWKRLKMRARRPVELALIKELAAWREREAQKRNTPRGRVLKDETLYELAMQQPATEEALSSLRSLGQGFARSRSGQEIMAIVQKVLAIPKDKLPKIPRVRDLGENNSAAVDLLKVLLKMTSEAHGVAPKLIANVDDLESIAADDSADVPALTGWRRKLFGENALKLKRGEIALKLTGRSVRIVPGSAEGPRAEAAE
jgi:ribonuclease D